MRRIAVVSAFFLFLTGCGPGVPRASERAEYQAKAQLIIDALEAHFKTHGEYPVAIEDVGLEHFQTPWGPTRYLHSAAGPHGGSFMFIIGDGLRYKYSWSYMGIGRHPNASNVRWTFFIDKTEM